MSALKCVCLTCLSVYLHEYTQWSISLSSQRHSLVYQSTFMKTCNGLSVYLHEGMHWSISLPSWRHSLVYQSSFIKTSTGLLVYLHKGIHWSIFTKAFTGLRLYEDIHSSISLSSQRHSLVYQSSSRRCSLVHQFIFTKAFICLSSGRHTSQMGASSSIKSKFIVIVLQVIWGQHSNKLWWHVGSYIYGRFPIPTQISEV